MRFGCRWSSEKKVEIPKDGKNGRFKNKHGTWLGRRSSWKLNLKVGSPSLFIRELRNVYMHELTRVPL